MLKLYKDINNQILKLNAYLYIQYEQDDSLPDSIKRYIPRKGKDLIQEEYYLKYKEELKLKGYRFIELTEIDLEEDEMSVIMDFEDLKFMLKQDTNKLKKVAELMYDPKEYKNSMLNLQRIMSGKYQFNNRQLIKFCRIISISPASYYFWKAPDLNISFNGNYFRTIVNSEFNQIEN